jgi:hypothetical protein
MVLPGEVNIISYWVLGSTRCWPVRENCFALSFVCPPELQHRRELSAFRYVYLPKPEFFAAGRRSAPCPGYIFEYSPLRNQHSAFGTANFFMDDTKLQS